jgi:diacylglycerol kinase family enzyme
MLMKSGEGNYVEHPAVFEVHSPWLRVASHNPTPLHADGEIQSSQVHQLEFRVLPGCLPLLHP